MQLQVKSEKYIQAKIFIGYTLLVILLAAIAYFTITSFRQLTHSADRLAEPNPRVDLLHKIVYSIYQAESNIRSYTLNQKDEFLNSYFEELTMINVMVDSLQVLAQGDSIISHTVDSINIELLNKTKLLEQFIVLKRLDVNSVIYHQAIENIFMAANGNKRVKETIHQTITDSLPEVPANISQEEVEREKNNFFDKLRNFFTGKRDGKDSDGGQTLPLQSDEIQAAAIRTDSVVTIYHDPEAFRREIENTMLTLFQDLYSRQDNLRRAETRILLEDKRVMDRIWTLVTSLEEHEREKALYEASLAHNTVRATTRKIMLVLLASVAVLIIFSWVLISDINRSRYYRQQLMAEKARAEDLVKVKQRFMANISHEIRTPLNSIVGFSRQLLKDNPASKSLIYSDAIHQSSKHLLEIVNDILDFSKMEAGKVVLQPETIDIEQIATDVYIALDEMARNKGLEFLLDTSKLQNKWVVGDALRIRQILFNLAGNAVKFTQSGWVKITLSTAKDQDKDFICITVEDTGIGIEPSQQEKIFDEFSQADSQSTRQFGGTGLGLTITGRLVEMMEGHYYLDSTPGEGSEFRVELPLPPAQQPEKINAFTEEILPENFTASILIVDDDRLNRLLVASILEPWKEISVTETDEPSKALELLAAKKFDILITDVQMPGMTGMELAMNIRGNGSPYSNIPIIACTADITPETINAIEEAGINCYLLKPFSETDLIKKLAYFLFSEKGESTGNIIYNNKTHAEINQVVVAKDQDQKQLYRIDGLLKFTGGNPVTTSSILNAFIADTLANINHLTLFLGSGNRKEIYFIAHKMSHMFELLDVADARGPFSRLGNNKVYDLTEDQLAIDVTMLIETSKKLIVEIEREQKSQPVFH